MLQVIIIIKYDNYASRPHAQEVVETSLTKSGGPEGRLGVPYCQDSTGHQMVSQSGRQSVSPAGRTVVKLTEPRGHDGMMPGSTAAVAQRRKNRRKRPLLIPMEICKREKGRWLRDEGIEVCKQPILTSPGARR